MFTTFHQIVAILVSYAIISLYLIDVTSDPKNKVRGSLIVKQ